MNHLVSITAAAKQCNVSIRRFRDRMKQRNIAPVKINRKHYLKANDVEALRK